MAEWSRETPWRQGHLLPDEAVTALGLDHPDHPHDTIVAVASHDSDLAQLKDREPAIEVIVGHKTQELDGNNTHAKSARTLHIQFEGDGILMAEFVATQKRSISKDSLANYKPVANKMLSPNGLVIFQTWLSIRYKRSAFPDDFERLLQNSKLDEKIANAVKKHGEEITAVFFDVDDGREETKEQGDVYILDIYLLHASDPDYHSAEKAAQKAQEAIGKAFESKLFDNQTGVWRDIELRSIEVISENALTYQQSKMLKKWRLDHFSLRAEPQQAIVEG
jgi:hypothetical protein